MGVLLFCTRDFSSNIVAVDTYDSRICAIKIISNIGPVLLICVYMATDDGSTDCFENYVATCAKITALVEDCDAIHTFIAGDFNCNYGTRFYSAYHNLVSDCGILMTDVNRLPEDSVTYCNDFGTAFSWIDHILCSPEIDKLV